MDYGNFKLAHDRYNIETSSNCPAPSNWSLDEIKIVLMTYKGTKLVNEDVMQTVEFGTQKIAIGNRPGEWLTYEKN